LNYQLLFSESDITTHKIPNVVSQTDEAQSDITTKDVNNRQPAVTTPVNGSLTTMILRNPSSNIEAIVQELEHLVIRGWSLNSSLTQELNMNINTSSQTKELLVLILFVEVI
jgi:hypothetical protein